MDSKEELRKRMLSLMVSQDWYLDRNLLEKVQKLMHQLCIDDEEELSKRLRYPKSFQVTFPDGRIEKCYSINKLVKKYEVTRFALNKYLSDGIPLQGKLDGCKIELITLKNEELEVNNQKKNLIKVLRPNGLTEVGSISEINDFYSCGHDTVYRAIKTQKPVRSGVLKGWRFEWVNEEENK